MSIVLSHVWGIWWWRGVHPHTPADAFRTNICRLGAAPSTAQEMKSAKIPRIRDSQTKRGIPNDLPIELLSGTPVQRKGLSFAKVRQWTGMVPLGSICEAEGLYVCSPEFCFVLIASDIKHICKDSLAHWQHAVILAELGCELCGTYSKQVSARGFRDRDIALISSCQLFTFAGLFAAERGGAMAFEALRWVIDGLNSPMETVLYLMLCLPRAWGGLGFPRPRANWSLEIPPELRKGWDKSHVIPDLFWPEFSLIAEYFGADAHAGKETPDLRRQELEQEMGCNVITFWKDDVKDLGRLNAKARALAKHMGRALPEPSQGFLARQRTLQQMLMGHQRWI